MTMLAPATDRRLAQSSPLAIDEAARVRSVLARASIFQGLATQVLDQLADAMYVRRVLGGQVVVPAGARGDALYLIMGGRIKLVQCGDSGREVTLSVLRPGDFCGEVAFFNESVRAPAAVALEPVTLLVWPAHEVSRHLAEHPATAMRMLGELAARLRRADDTIAEFALCDVNERLIRKLVALAREDMSESTGGELVLRRRPTQQDLANMVGSCRETISRTYNQLVRQGLLMPRGRGLVLSPRLVGMM